MLISRDVWTDFRGRIVLGWDQALNRLGSFPSTACVALGESLCSRSTGFSSKPCERRLVIFIEILLFESPSTLWWSALQSSLHNTEAKDPRGYGNWANDLLLICWSPFLQQWYHYANITTLICANHHWSMQLLECTEPQQGQISSIDWAPASRPTTFSQAPESLAISDKSKLVFAPECMEDS